MFLHDHVALTVRDLPTSRRFYESLGGHVVSKPSPSFLEILLGEVRLHLVKGGDPKLGPSAHANETEQPVRIDHLCLRVATVDKLRAIEEHVNGLLVSEGHAPCRVEDSPPFGAGGTHVEERPPRKTLYFKDPDGIRLEVRAYA